MTLNEFLSGFEGVKKVADGFLVRCNSHDDSTASLSVRVLDGWITPHCFAGCSKETILQNRGVSKRDLLIDGQLISYPENNSIVAKYDYVDEVGQVLFQIRRDAGKKFKAFHHNGKAWVAGLNGQRKVLYRLNEVAKAQSAYVVEGEKDVDTMAAMGFVATCNPFGAGKWQPEHSESLRDKVVNILPDNDDPGRKHAELVARSLHGIAKEIYIVKIPKGKDVSDFIAAGGTADDIIDLVQRGEPWNPAFKERIVEQPKAAPTFQNILVVEDWDQALRRGRDMEKPNRLFGDLFYEGEVCLFFGPTGRGKSVLATDIARACVAGRSIDPRLEVDGGARVVLYLDCEMSDRQQAKRYEQDFGIPGLKRATIDPKYISLDTELTEQLLISIEQSVEQCGAKVVVLDNITWFTDETEKSKAVLPLMKALLGMARRLKISVLVVAHTGKRPITTPISTAHLFGSSMFSILADGIFAINESAKDSGLRYLKQCKASRIGGEIVYTTENVLTCEIVKRNGSVRFEFLSECHEEEHLPAADGVGRRITPEQEATIEKMLRETNLSQHSIAKELRVSSSTVNRIAKHSQDESVRSRSRGKRTNEQREEDIPVRSFVSLTEQAERPERHNKLRIVGKE